MSGGNTSSKGLSIKSVNSTYLGKIGFVFNKFINAFSWKILSSFSAKLRLKSSNELFSSFKSFPSSILVFVLV